MNDQQLFKNKRFYPPWRVPLIRPSIFGAKWLVKHGLKNPQRISYLMIIIGFLGGTLFFFNDLFLNFVGWCLIILSYFLDMMDGKTSKLLGKNLKSLVGFLDNQFHIPITSYILFLIGLRIYLNTNNVIFLLLGFFTAWIFIWKTMMQFSFEVHYLEVKPPSNPADYEDEMSRKTYHTMMYDTKGLKHYAYICTRPFLDATDILIFLLPVLILKLEPYFLISIFILHLSLLFYKFHNHIQQLKPEEVIA